MARIKSELVLLEPIIEKYSFARILDADEKRELYQEVNEIVERDYENIPAFPAYWKFNEETGKINGSNLPILILANKILAKKNQRTLTFVEGIKLDKAKKLSNEVYRDFGLVVYSPGEPNKEIAELLVKEANRRNWELPVIAHPSALEIPSRKANNNYRIDILFSDNDSLIISGEEAREVLKEFYAHNSGVCRLDRGGLGFWDAGWDLLASSYADGRVDWIRGEATHENLERELFAEIERSAQKSPYSTKEALKMYKVVEEIRKGDVKISDLESRLSQVSSFLENLSK